MPPAFHPIIHRTELSSIILRGVGTTLSAHPELHRLSWQSPHPSPSPSPNPSPNPNPSPSPSRELPHHTIPYHATSYRPARLPRLHSHSHSHTCVPGASPARPILPTHVHHLPPSHTVPHHTIPPHAVHNSFIPAPPQPQHLHVPRANPFRPAPPAPAPRRPQFLHPRTSSATASPRPRHHTIYTSSPPRSQRPAPNRPPYRPTKESPQAYTCGLACYRTGTPALVSEITPRFSPPWQRPPPWLRRPAWPTWPRLPPWRSSERPDRRCLPASSSRPMR